MNEIQFHKIINLKKLGKFAEAKYLYLNALKSGDYDPRIFTALAKIYFLQDDYQQAINSYMIFFTIQKELGYSISQFSNEIFHVFMNFIRNTELVAIMENNGIDGGNIIWRLRNADSVCAYKNAIMGFLMDKLVKGIDYGRAGEAISYYGSDDIDPNNYMQARNIFDNIHSFEKDFIIDSINKSISQYENISVNCLVEKLIK